MWGWTPFGFTLRCSTTALAGSTFSKPMSLLRDLRDPASSLGFIARRAREKRFELFKNLLGRVPRPLRILDIGGRPEFWQTMNFVDVDGVELTLINIGMPPETTFQNMCCLEADARHLEMFKDREFDIVFSNSVIEHVGGTADQQRMAEEVQRVGSRYFVQTPNRNFPVEPHFAFPMFQFLPLTVQASLLMNLNLAWSGKVSSREKAEKIAKSVKLLSRREFTSMFPHANVYEERFFGLVKSFVCYAGW